MSVAAVYLTPEAEKLLREAGVKDSKKLSDKRIIELAHLIKSTENVDYEVLVLEPKIYNELYETAQNQILLLLAMYKKVLNNLYDRTRCKLIFVDQFSHYDIKLKSKDIKLITEIKAENKHLNVAAASILARAEILNWFKDYPDLIKGSSPAAFEQLEYINELDPKNMDLYVKMHFHRVREFIKKIR
jgi:ribonuclease HIII